MSENEVNSFTDQSAESTLNVLPDINSCPNRVGLEHTLVEVNESEKAAVIEFDKCDCPLENGAADERIIREDIISNRRRKKLIKFQKWLEYKPIKRAKERDKVKKRKFEAKLNNVKLGPSRKTLKKAKMSTSNCKVNVVIDFSFNHLMNNKDLNKCLKQLGFCYGANRRVPNPVQFYVTSFDGTAKEEMEKNEGYTNWDVYFKTESFTDLFTKSDIIYLTSDSDNVINELLDNKCYIIGGLVDHNSYKGLCLKTAEKLGINHGRLPIEENIDMKTRRVLAINHVFEILVNVSNGWSWKDALLKVIPVRKGVSEKSHESLDSECSEKPEIAPETNEAPPNS